MKYKIGDKLFEILRDDDISSINEPTWCVYEVVDIFDDIYILNLVVSNGNHQKALAFYEKELDTFTLYKFDNDCSIEAQVCSHLI